MGSATFVMFPLGHNAQADACAMGFWDFVSITFITLPKNGHKSENE